MVRPVCPEPVNGIETTVHGRYLFIDSIFKQGIPVFR
jgi:hypothetical protein